MAEKTTTPAADADREVFLEQAKAAGLARLAEARNDAAAVAWAEKTANRLKQRLHERRAS
ncbi:hypothetical protein ACIRRA_44615 [Nocardia sp. NPDC101769]|uniref:hypothetical protein n=1 Tax=Nocardia sp. NPDC101769 TaxID=3364333 RepID=UPI0037FE59F2